MVVLAATVAVMAIVAPQFDRTWSDVVSASQAHPSHEPARERTGSIVGLDVVAHDGAIEIVTAVREKNNVSLKHRRSSDGGRTWTASRGVNMHGVDISMAMRGLDPQIAAAGERLFVVWTTPGDGQHGVGRLGTSVSTNGGVTWQASPNPADDGTDRGHAFIDAIAEPSGALKVVWLENRGTRGLQIASSPDMGATWGKTQTIDTITCECCWNDLIVRKPGELLVLYRDRDPRDMAIAATSNGGAKWTRLATVGDFKWGIDGCPFTGGGLAFTGPETANVLHSVVFSGQEGHEGVSYLNSRDLGRTWSTPHALGQGQGQHADIASVGESLVVVYDVADAKSGQIVVMKRSEDAGQTWSAATRLSTPGRRAEFPRVVSASGRWLALWTERSDTGPTELKEKAF